MMPGGTSILGNQYSIEYLAKVNIQYHAVPQMKSNPLPAESFVWVIFHIWELHPKERISYRISSPLLFGTHQNLSLASLAQKGFVAGVQ